MATLRTDLSDYLRHAAGTALRNIHRTFPTLLAAETATWNRTDPREQFTYQRVLKAR